MPNTLEELRTLERDVEREWWWLHGALNAVAHARTEHAHGDLRSFREMQAQALEVDRRRVQIAVRALLSWMLVLTSPSSRSSNSG